MKTQGNQELTKAESNVLEFIRSRDFEELKNELETVFEIVTFETESELDLIKRNSIYELYQLVKAFKGESFT
jgi:predicted house-cleaning noncanonical NTP pyrophosphatase (MazG superfamily)